MHPTRAEKDIYLTNAITMGGLDHIRNLLEKEAILKGEHSRALTYSRNTLDEVNQEVLKKFGSQRESDKFVLRLKKDIETIKTKTKITNFVVEESLPEKVKLHFSNFFAAFIGIRDCLNYYKENPEKIPKNTLTKLKTSRTLFRKMFKKHIKDAEMDWEAIIGPLENKLGQYEFEAKLIVY